MVLGGFFFPSLSGKLSMPLSGQIMAPFFHCLILVVDFFLNFFILACVCKSIVLCVVALPLPIVLFLHAVFGGSLICVLLICFCLSLLQVDLSSFIFIYWSFYFFSSSLWLVNNNPFYIDLFSLYCFNQFIVFNWRIQISLELLFPLHIDTFGYDLQLVPSCFLPSNQFHFQR